MSCNRWNKPGRRKTEGGSEERTLPLYRNFTQFFRYLLFFRNVTAFRYCRIVALFSSKSGNFRPKLSNFRSKLSNFRPKLSNFRPKLGNFRPKLGNFRSKLGNFRPKLLNFRPKSGNFRPKSGNFRPKLGNFRPKLGNFRPKLGIIDACFLEKQKEAVKSEHCLHLHIEILQNFYISQVTIESFFCTFAAGLRSYSLVCYGSSKFDFK
jgi:hypothetical protein